MFPWLVPPAEMAATVKKYKDQGYKRFQLKLGGDPDEDIVRIKRCREQLDDDDTLVGDSNTGWTTHQALRIAAAVKDIDVYIELEGRWSIYSGFYKQHSSKRMAKRYCSNIGNCFGIAEVPGGNGRTNSLNFPIRLTEGYDSIHKREIISGNLL